MRVSAHIAFYCHALNIQQKRNTYIVQVINDYLNTWTVTSMDIFIHTNSESAKYIEPHLNYGSHIKIEFIIHDLSAEKNPKYLTWKHRELMEKQKNDYDVFVYLEDDTGVPNKAFQYWLKFKDEFKKKRIDLGFARVETLDNKEYFCHDILTPCKGWIKISDTIFTWNHAHFAAFWILDREELHNFIASKFWPRYCFFPNGLHNPESQFIQESAGIGFKMSYTGFFNGGFYPINTDTRYVLDDCIVYHLANNYVGGGVEQGNFNIKRMTEKLFAPLQNELLQTPTE